MTIQTPAHVIAALNHLNLPLDEMIPVKNAPARH
jgi:hypothetical protein